MHLEEADVLFVSRAMAELTSELSVYASAVASDPAFFSLAGFEATSAAH